MIALETLRQMPLREKLFTMEALWDTLSQGEAALPVQDWHKELLDEREAAVEAGTAEFIDWEDAKQQILGSVK